MVPRVRERSRRSERHKRQPSFSPMASKSSENSIFMKYFFLHVLIGEGYRDTDLVSTSASYSSCYGNRKRQEVSTPSEYPTQSLSSERQKGTTLQTQPRFFSRPPSITLPSTLPTAPSPLLWPQLLGPPLPSFLFSITYDSIGKKTMRENNSHNTDQSKPKPCSFPSMQKKKKKSYLIG